MGFFSDVIIRGLRCLTGSWTSTGRVETELAPCFEKCVLESFQGYSELLKCFRVLYRVLAPILKPNFSDHSP